MYRFLKNRKQSFNGCRSVIMNNGKKQLFFFSKKSCWIEIDTTQYTQQLHFKSNIWSAS